MIGTYANTVAIVVGTLIGCGVKKGLNEKQSHALMQAMGLAATALGIYSIVSNMEKSTTPVLFIVALAIGGFLGQWLELDTRLNALGQRFQKLGNLEGLTTAVLLFCFVTLSILVPIESALNNNRTYHFTNATLDFVTSMVLASTFGFSILYAAVILFCWQGAIYLGATILAPFITDTLMAEIGIVGGVLIVSTGLSILKVLKIKTINFFPALAVPPLSFLVLSFFKG